MPSNYATANSELQNAAPSDNRTIALSTRLRALAQTYVSRLTIRGPKAIGCCIFHDEKTPSLSFDFDKGVFLCFGCNKSGGVRDFARAVGEPWGNTRSQSRVNRAHFAGQVRRRQAEEQACAILARRAEAHHKALCLQNHRAIQDANEAAELLALFHRRPDLAEEFPELVARTEREYSDALFQQTILEAQLVEGVEVGK